VTIKEHPILYSFQRDNNGSAYGATHIFKGPNLPQYANYIHLLQPYNAWAAEHFNPGRADEDALRIVQFLHEAYNAGRESMKIDIHDLLRLNNERR
jgi:hypothetical protein